MKLQCAVLNFSYLCSTYSIMGCMLRRGITKSDSDIVSINAGRSSDTSVGRNLGKHRSVIFLKNKSRYNSNIALLNFVICASDRLLVVLATTYWRRLKNCW